MAEILILKEFPPFFFFLPICAKTNSPPHHLPQAIWADGGYTWAEVSFSQEYTDPKIHIQLEHLKRLPVLFLTLNLSAKTSRGVFVRSNMAKEKIDVDYSVYLYVEEMADT